MSYYLQILLILSKYTIRNVVLHRPYAVLSHRRAGVDGRAKIHVKSIVECLVKYIGVDALSIGVRVFQRRITQIFCENKMLKEDDINIVEHIGNSSGQLQIFFGRVGRTIEMIVR